MLSVIKVIYRYVSYLDQMGSLPSRNAMVGCYECCGWCDRRFGYMLSNYGSLLARHGILRLPTFLHQAFGRALRTGPSKGGWLLIVIATFKS